MSDYRRISILIELSNEAVYDTGQKNKLEKLTEQMLEVGYLNNPIMGKIKHVVEKMEKVAKEPISCNVYMENENELTIKIPKNAIRNFFSENDTIYAELVKDVCPSKCFPITWFWPPLKSEKLIGEHIFPIEFIVLRLIEYTVWLPGMIHNYSSEDLCTIRFPLEINKH